MNNIRVVKRIGVLLAGAGAGLYPVLSCALGLGEIQVESRLNQPLRARIEIVGLVDLDSAPIRAGAAGGGGAEPGRYGCGGLESGASGAKWGHVESGAAGAQCW
jgi:Tfp pilus assembly protein FimV